MGATAICTSSARSVPILGTDQDITALRSAKSADKLAYGVAETAHALGIGRTKLYEQIGAGRLRTRKIGSRTVIPAEELHRYLSTLPEGGAR
jgi:excisionase family DNA binding protein